MSGKLDQSLDQIMQDGGSTTATKGRRAGRPNARRAAQKAKAAIAAPTGGVPKSTRGPKPAPKAPAHNSASVPVPTVQRSSKVMISGLPEDVKEKDLKDYLTQAVGGVRSVIISYGPTGRSRGQATVVFNNPQSSALAVRNVHGIKIDGRAVKVEIIYDGTAVAPPPGKSLADRMSKPKSAAKEIKAAPKPKVAAPAAANGAAATKTGKGKKTGRAGRPKKKTADELDAEMMDYFGNEAAPATNGAAAPAAPATAANGTAEPVDEVM